MGLYQKSISQLFDLEKFLERITPKQYTQPLPDLSQASLGQHVRHILEFHKCLLKANSENPIVCYDNRERDPNIEQNIEVALQTIRVILETIDPGQGDFQIVLKTLGEKDNEMKIDTTFFRELWYVYEHTTHHMAILKIGAFLLGVQQLPENFGVADSTIAFRNSLESKN